MKAKIALIAFLLFLSVLPVFKPVFAALTITSLSTDTLNSSDDTLIINASASGLQNSTQYLEITFTKDGESSNYFGLTLNNSGEWYQYKSSPSTSDLSSYFYNFTPSNGVWSGQIQAKFDINDAGFKGPGKYNVKLLKFITSSSTSSNILSINVNISPTPTNTPTPLPTNSPTPTPKPTNTSTPTPTKTLTPTSKPSLTLTPTPSPTKILPDSVLGEATNSALPTKAEEKGDVKTESLSFKPDNLIAKIFIFLGVVFLLTCAIVIAYPFTVRFKREKLSE